MLMRTFIIISSLFSSFSLVTASEVVTEETEEREIIFSPDNLRDVFKTVVFDPKPTSITEKKILCAYDANDTIEIRYRDENHLAELKLNFKYIYAKNVKYILDPDLEDDCEFKESCPVDMLYFTHVEAEAYGPLTVTGNFYLAELLVFPEGSNVDGLVNKARSQFLRCPEANLVDAVVANRMESKKRKARLEILMALSKLLEEGENEGKFKKKKEE